MFAFQPFALDILRVSFLVLQEMDQLQVQLYDQLNQALRANANSSLEVLDHDIPSAFSDQHFVARQADGSHSVELLPSGRHVCDQSPLPVRFVVTTSDILCFDSILLISPTVPLFFDSTHGSNSMNVIDKCNFCVMVLLRSFLWKLFRYSLQKNSKPVFVEKPISMLNFSKYGSVVVVDPSILSFCPFSV